MLADFFKKDVTAYPSGEKAAEHKGSRYGSALKKMGMALGGFVIAASMVSCVSKAKIEEMKAQVPAKEKIELTCAYDSILLHKIDSLHAGGVKMEKAVEKGHDLAWNQISKDMPGVFSWTGKEYVQKEHAEKRVEQSRDKHVKKEMKPYTTMIGDTEQLMYREEETVSYTYKAGFRDRLAKEVAQHQNRNAAAQAAVRPQGR